MCKTKTDLIALLNLGKWLHWLFKAPIKRLRNKIDSNFSPKLIQNIRGMGYVLEVEDDS